MSSKITELYQLHKDENPDILLKRIQSYFEEAGKSFSRGLMTEEEFYLATSFDMVYIDLWKMKNHIVFSQRELEKEYHEFSLSWDEWKETGTVTTKKWMFLCISQSGNMKDSTEWVFKVIDTLKIPLIYFQPLATCQPPITTFPDVIYQISQSQNTVRTLLTERCMNMVTLLDEPNPIGKTFVFQHEHGSTVEVTIEKKYKGGFLGMGTVPGYMSKPGTIEIEQIEGKWHCLFNKIHCDPLSIAIGAAPLTLPDPIWNEYNAAHMIRTMRYVTEYKVLRVPYMMGCASSSPSQGQKSIHNQSGSIIDFNSIVRITD